MNKKKRKLLRIKEMRREGLSYEERARKIGEASRLFSSQHTIQYKDLEKEPEVNLVQGEISGRCLKHDLKLIDGVCSKCYRKSWIRRIIEFFGFGK